MSKLKGLTIGDVYQKTHPTDGKHYLVTGVVCLKGETYIQSVAISISGKPEFNFPFYLTETMLEGCFKYNFHLDELIHKTEIALNQLVEQLDLPKYKYRVLRYSWATVNTSLYISECRIRLAYFEQLRACYSGNVENDLEFQFHELQMFRGKVEAFGKLVNTKAKDATVQVCPNILCLDSITPLAQLHNTDLTSIVVNYFNHIPKSIDRNREFLVLAYRSVEGFPDLAEYYLLFGFVESAMPEYLTFTGAKPRYSTELQICSQHSSVKSLMPQHMDGNAFLLQDWLSSLMESIRFHHPHLETVETVCEQLKPVLPIVKNMQYVFFDLASRLENSETRFDQSHTQEYLNLFDAILHGEARQTDFKLQYRDGSVIVPWETTEGDSTQSSIVIDLATLGLDEDLLICDLKLFDLVGHDDVYTKLRDWSVTYLPVFDVDCPVYHKEYQIALEYKANLHKSRDFLLKVIRKYLHERKSELTPEQFRDLEVQTMAILDKQYQFQPLTFEEPYESTPEWLAVKETVDSLLGESPISESIMNVIREKEKSLIDSYVLEAITYGNVGVCAYFSTINPDNRMEPYAWVKEFTVLYDKNYTSFKEVDSSVLLQYVKFAYLRNHPDNILGLKQSEYFISSTDKHLALQYVQPTRATTLLNVFKNMDQLSLDALCDEVEVCASDLLKSKVLSDISWFLPYALIEHKGELYYAGYYNKQFVSMLGHYRNRLNIQEDKLINTLDGIYGAKMASTMDDAEIFETLRSMIYAKGNTTPYALIHRDEYIPLTSQNNKANIVLIPHKVAVIEVDYDFFFLDVQNTIKKPGYYSIELPKNKQLY